MACFHPVWAWYDDRVTTEKGKPLLRFNISQLYGRSQENPHIHTLQVPCGKCDGCLMARAKSWAMRCVHEAAFHEKNCFLTLTYSPECLPIDGSVNKREMQLFMKRYRKKFGSGIRFFLCGEYGAANLRPHYHVIIFGHDFDDKVVYKHDVNTGVTLYTSRVLSGLWPFGFSTVGAVSERACAYTARYILKKQFGRKAESHYRGLTPEFVNMSRKPGIGYEWIMKYHSDVYPQDYVVNSAGLKARPPAYYDKIYDNIGNIEDIKLKRIEKIKDNPDYNDPARLAVREKCQQLRQKRLVRTYENPV